MSNVALIDIRHLDGEAWDVARKAGAQADDCFMLLEEALEGLFWSARGAWLSQEDYREGQMPKGDEFPLSPIGRKLAVAHDAIGVARKAVKVATAAASHDPRSI